MAEDHSSDLHWQLLKARECNLNHLWDNAAQILQDLYSQHPGNFYLLYNLINSYLKIGWPILAHKAIKKLVKNFSKHGFAHYFLGLLAVQAGKPQVAVQQLKHALKKGVPCQLALKLAVETNLKNNYVNEALELMTVYWKKYQYHNWYILLWTEILLKMGNSEEALQTLRQILNIKFSKQLLLKYLKIKYICDKREPLVSYNLLRKQLNPLPELSDKDLRDLYIDYLFHHREWYKAGKVLQEYILLAPDKLYWTKRLIQLYELKGNTQEFEKVAGMYFLGDPGDITIAKKLEHYFIQSYRLGDWITLLEKAFSRHPTHQALFNYSRLFFQNRDWLQKNPFSIDDFYRMLEPFHFKVQFPLSGSWKNFPLQVFEYFCLYFRFKRDIPSVSDFYQHVIQLYRYDPARIPFTEEDLKKAYPVWVFGLHFYFLFQSFSSFQLSFNPHYFYLYGIGLLLHLPGHSIAIDVSSLLQEELDTDFDWFNKMGIQILRWPAGVRPNTTIAGIPLFSKLQIPSITSLIETQIYTLRKEVVS